MLSQKAKYALQALGHLAAHYGEGPVQLASIAAQHEIPLGFLENIMHELKPYGFLESFRGRGGGYALTKNPASIKLANVIRQVDGPIAMLSCVSLHFYEPCAGCVERRCKLRKVMTEARDAILSVLEGKTLADIA
jgi:Rrf2 family protein